MANLTGKNSLIVVLVLVCIGLGIGLAYSGSCPEGEEGAKAVSKAEAASIVLDYINNNILSGDLQASLIGDVIEESGLYKMQIKIQDDEFSSYITGDGKILFPQGIDLAEAQEEEGEEEEEPAQDKFTLGSFSVSEDEVCTEDGKPIVYFFGADYCPHCHWEHPVVEAVAGEFEGFISFHDNMDSDADRDIFTKYSTGGIPTVVLGCKYYRVGSGERSGEEKETKNLTALICNLTENQPAGVCEAVKDLIEQID